MYCYTHTLDIEFEVSLTHSFIHCIIIIFQLPIRFIKFIIMANGRVGEKSIVFNNNVKTIFFCYSFESDEFFFNIFKNKSI